MRLIFGVILKGFRRRKLHLKGLGGQERGQNEVGNVIQHFRFGFWDHALSAMPRVSIGEGPWGRGRGGGLEFIPRKKHLDARPVGGLSQTMKSIARGVFETAEFIFFPKQ